MKNITLRSMLTLCFCCLFSIVSFTQININGKIVDDEGEPLIGATIKSKKTSLGTITDFDGLFNLTTSESYPATLEISYTGYATQKIIVDKDDDALDIILLEVGIDILGVVITASRRPEKVQNAPAPVSVLSPRQLANSPDTDVTRTLGNMVGVTIQQQSASRLNIEMRGSNGIFGTAVFPIMDYRNLQGAGTGTFQSSAVGISMIDLDRVEVVRGPGSALYGPGVTSGVVHYITKSPISHPGTTVELIGGELATFGGTIRHATKLSDKFGFKINAQYKRGNEFILDINDPEDAAQIANMQNTVGFPVITNGAIDLSQPPETLIDNLDEDGDGNPMTDEWFNSAINATLEFRPQEDMSFFLSGGYNRSMEVFYNSQGEGLNNSGEYWGQARFQKGGLFAQVFYSNNDGGTRERPSFLYQTGLVSILSRQQLEGQVQYNFGVENLLDSDFTVGVDYRSALSDSKNLSYGRNENNDDYLIYGAYAQGKFKLHDKLDLVLAGRYDEFNFLDEGFFAPRAAIVFKPLQNHTIRASYNKAGSPPSAINMYLDLPVSAPVPGLFDVWIGGNTIEQTYNEDPVIDMTVPGFPDLPVGTPGLPLAIPYGAITPGVLEALAANGMPSFVTDFLTTYTPTAMTGTLEGYNIFNGEPLVPTNNTPISIQTFDTYEVGYNGFMNDKLKINLDVYYNKIRGFREFTALGPTYKLVGSDIPTDISSDVATALTDYLQSIGVPQTDIDALVPIVAGAYAQGGTAFNDEVAPLFPIFGAAEGSIVPQNDGVVHVPAGNLNFADATIDYVGIDIGLNYYLTTDLNVYFNYSYLSKTQWEAGEGGLGFPYSLNTPKNKFRTGVNYAPETSGLSGAISFQHTPSYEVSFGQYGGTTDVQNLVDASIAYQLDNGLKIGLTANNLFNSEYRFAPNFPKIGRRVLAKVTYTFGNNKEE